MRIGLFLLLAVTLFASKEIKQRLEFGYFGTTGNTNVKSLSAGYKLTYRPSAKYKTQIKADVYTSTRNGEKSSERIRGELDFYYYKKRDFYYYLQNGFLRNVFEGYSQQYNINPGIGLTIYKDAKNSLDTLAGYLFRRDIYTNNTNKSFNYLKGEIKYLYKLTKKNRFKLDVNYIYNIENNKDFETNLKSHMKLLISGNFSFKISFELKYDNMPVEGKKKTDTISKASIVYNF